MRTNDNQKNNLIDQNLELQNLEGQKNQLQKNQLQKTWEWFKIFTKYLLHLGAINIIIISYFRFKPDTDIIYSPTGWISIPSWINWYDALIALLLFRMFINYTTRELARYIKDFSPWSEEKKRHALYVLAFINFLTIPVNIPLIGALYAYSKGSEILSNNMFTGTFRRILNDDERKELFNQTLHKFLEKIEVSKEIKNKLQNWAIDNTQKFMDSYDDGSGFGETIISQHLETQKTVFLKEELTEKLTNITQLENVIEQTPKSNAILRSMFDKTLDTLNYLNPFVTDPKTCAMSWIFLLGSIAIIAFVSKEQVNFWNERKQTHENISSLAKTIKTQQNLIKQNQKDIKDQLELVKLDQTYYQINTDNVIIQMTTKMEHQQECNFKQSELNEKQLTFNSTTANNLETLAIDTKNLRISTEINTKALEMHNKSLTTHEGAIQTLKEDALATVRANNPTTAQGIHRLRISDALGNQNQRQITQPVQGLNLFPMPKEEVVVAAITGVIGDNSPETIKIITISYKVILKCINNSVDY